MIYLNILIIMILSSFWGIILSQFFDPWLDFLNYIGFGEKRRIVSKVKLIDYMLYCIHKAFHCTNCLSFWICSIILTIYLHSFIGFFLGIASYFLVAPITRWFNKL